MGITIHYQFAQDKNKVARNKNKKMKEIQQNKWYSLAEMVENKLFPWIKSYQAYRNIILGDKMLPKNQRKLDAVILGEGRAKIIRIKGSNIISYLANHDETNNRNQRSGACKTASK